MQPKFIAVKILNQYYRHLNRRKVDCITTTPQHPPHPPVRKPLCNHTHKTRNAIGEVTLLIIASVYVHTLWSVWAVSETRKICSLYHCCSPLICNCCGVSDNKMLMHICHDFVSPVAHSSFINLMNCLHFKSSFWILLIPHVPPGLTVLC